MGHICDSSHMHTDNARARTRAHWLKCISLGMWKKVQSELKLEYAEIHFPWLENLELKFDVFFSFLHNYGFMGISFSKRGWIFCVFWLSSETDRFLMTGKSVTRCIECHLPRSSDFLAARLAWTSVVLPNDIMAIRNNQEAKEKKSNPIFDSATKYSINATQKSEYHKNSSKKNITAICFLICDDDKDDCNVKKTLPYATLRTYSTRIICFGLYMLKGTTKPESYKCLRRRRRQRNRSKMFFCLCLPHVFRSL